MKILIFSTLVFSFISHSQVTATQVPDTFNQALAEKLGADEYGMKMYVMAFLKKGPSSGSARTRS